MCHLALAAVILLGRVKRLFLQALEYPSVFIVGHQLPSLTAKLRQLGIHVWVHDIDNILAAPDIASARGGGDRGGIGRAAASRLRILVHWAKILHMPCPDEEFRRGSAGAVQARFLESLIREFGPQMIRILTSIIPKNSLSDNPKRDFVNSADGSVYAHKPVLGSDLYLCTKSDNEQKRHDILYWVQSIRLSDGSRFPDGSVEVFLTPGMSRAELWAMI